MNAGRTCLHESIGAGAGGKGAGAGGMGGSVMDTESGAVIVATTSAGEESTASPNPAAVDARLMAAMMPAACARPASGSVAKVFICSEMAPQSVPHVMVYWMVREVLAWRRRWAVAPEGVEKSPQRAALAEDY